MDPLFILAEPRPYAIVPAPRIEYTGLLPGGSLAGLWVIADYTTTPNALIPNRQVSTPPSTNLFRASRRLFTNAVLWHAVNVTMTDDAVAGPDAVVDASTLVSTATDWALSPYYVAPTIPAGTYTLACSVKRNTGSNQQFAFTKDGRATRSAAQTATSSWQRFSYTFTLGAGTNPVDIGLCSKDASTNANIAIRDLELFPGSADLGPVTPDTHLYTRDIYASGGSYSGGFLSSADGIIQFPDPLNLAAFTVQACVEITGAAENGVLANAANYTQFHATSQGPLGPEKVTGADTAIYNFNGTGSDGGVPQHEDLFNLVGLGAHVFTWRWDTTALELWLDDLRLFRDEEAIAPSARDLLFNATVLGSGYNQKYAGAVVLWTRAITDGEIRQAFAGQKTLAAAAGVTLTGDTTDRIYVAEGDSISGGYGQICYPFVYGAHDSPRVIGTCWAVNGSTIADLNTRASRVDAIVPPTGTGGRKFLLSVLIGANDLRAYPGASDAIAAAAYAADLAAYCDARRARGFKVVVCTILPSTRSSEATHNARRALVNTAIAGWVGVHCDAIADFAADATMGPDAAAHDATYYIDGTHPTVAGHNILETIIRPVLNAL